MAGMVAWTGTYPIDVVSTRMAASKGKDPNILKFTSDIVKKEGIKALYKGWVPCMIGVIPYCCSGFFYYKYLKLKLK